MRLDSTHYNRISRTLPRNFCSSFNGNFVPHVRKAVILGIIFVSHATGEFVLDKVEKTHRVIYTVLRDKFDCGFKTKRFHRAGWPAPSEKSRAEYIEILSMLCA